MLKDQRFQDTYNKNIKAIKCQETVRKIESAVIPDNWRLDNGITLQSTEGPQTYHNLMIDNKPYYTAPNFIQEARRDVEMQGEHSSRTVIFFGAGLGYHLFAFLLNKRFSSNFINVVIVDPDPAMMKIMLHALDLTKLLETKNVYFVTGREENDMLQYLVVKFKENYAFKHFKNVTNVYSYTPYYEQEKEYFDMFYRHWKNKLLQSHLNYGTSIIDGLEGFYNTMDSVEHVVRNRGISSLFGKFKNKPGLIVAAGPSLNKNIELIEECLDRCVVIAVDSALKPLLRRGIIPHIVTTIERGEGPLNYYTDLEELVDIEELQKNMIFAPAAVIHKSLYEQMTVKYNVPTFTVFRDFSDFKWTELDKGIITSGKSSANLAFNMLAKLECNPIVLVGQDLAFGETGETHTKGCDHSSEGMKKSHKITEERWVMGNNGKPIRTLETWEHFLRDYEVDISVYKGQVFNCTEGGALIHGTKFLPLAKVIKTVLRTRFDPTKTLMKICLENSEDFKESKKKLLDKINETIKYSKSLQEDCKEIIKEANAVQDEVKNLKSLADAVPLGANTKLHQRYAKMRNSKMFFQFLVHSAQSHYNISDTQMNDVLRFHASLAERVLAETQIIKGFAAVTIATAVKKTEAIIKAKQVLEGMDA